MDERRGWFGLTSQMMHYLDTVGADRDEEGKFKVAPAGSIAFGFGGQEVVVSADAVYFRGGKPVSLASQLSGTSYGTSPVVIMGGEA